MNASAEKFANRPVCGAASRSYPWRALAASFARKWDELRHAAAVIGTVLLPRVRPHFWARAVRTAFARQVLAIGVEPLGLSAL